MFSTIRRLLIVAASALLLAPAGCEKRDDPVTATARFCELIKTGKTHEAYASTAFGFQAQQSEKVFAATVREMGLVRMSGVRSEIVEDNGRSVKLRAEILGPENQAIPLNITLTSEAGAWRIFSLTSPRNAETGVIENRFSLVGKTPGFTAPVDQPMPGDAEVKRLSKEAMLKFNEAIRANSFEGFSKFVSDRWQKQVTVGQLQRAFKGFVEKNVDLAQIQDLDPVIDPPAEINTDGLLEVFGNFAILPKPVFFHLKFTYELPKWKLFGIDVHLAQ